MEAQVGNGAEKGGKQPIDYPKHQQRHKQFPSGLQWPQLLPICGNSADPFSQAYSIIFHEAGGGSSELEGLQLSHG